MENMRPWAAAAIDKWSTKGIILGTDGEFRPNDSITRAEFVTIINRVFGFVDKSEETFSDVPATAWYADAIAKAVAAGTVNGDGTGKFNPNNPITCQEAAVIFYRVFVT